MKIEKLTIDNFKSLNNFTLENPNPFSVFVGANGVGKSNIFEALEYLNYKIPFLRKLKDSFVFSEIDIIDGLFSGYKNFVNFNRFEDDLNFTIQFEGSKISNFKRFGFEKPDIKKDSSIETEIAISATSGIFENQAKYLNGPFDTPYPNLSIKNEVDKIAFEKNLNLYLQFVHNFSRIFIKARDKQKLNINSDFKLSLDCSNLEKVLKRLLLDNSIKEEIKDWLSLFVPAFKDIEVKSDEFSGTDALRFYEKDSERPFTKNLISDGTFNILCLLVAVYQSDSPQFICIEEPEIGLNPYVVKELVTFFREQCREKGHYIWINTHSETLVRALLPEEIIVVNKEDGNTVAKQFKDKDLRGLSMDTAWLSNYLGGGLPW